LGEILGGMCRSGINSIFMHTQFWLEIPAFVRGTECKSAAKRLFSVRTDELLQMIVKNVDNMTVEVKHFWGKFFSLLD
jgi:hypothetical protein